MQNIYKIETSVSKNGPWIDTGLIEPEPESARLTATILWGKQQESRPWVRAIRDGATRHSFLCRAGKFRKLWDNSWARIIERDINGYRVKQ